MNKINKIPASEGLTFEWGENYQRAKRSIRQLLRALEGNKAGGDDDGSIQATQGERTTLRLAREDSMSVSSYDPAPCHCRLECKTVHRLLYRIFTRYEIMGEFFF